MSLAQQHQLEHTRRRVGLEAACADDLSLARGFKLPRDGVPVEQLVQPHVGVALNELASAC